jgi:tripeptidyl-peptidase-1
VQVEDTKDKSSTEYFYDDGPAFPFKLIIAERRIMLLQSIVAALASGFVLEAMAGPLSHEYTGARTKREVPSSHSLHERHLPLWSQQWTKRSKVPDTQILPMRIGMKQCNLEAGHDKLMDM